MILQLGEKTGQTGEGGDWRLNRSFTSPRIAVRPACSLGESAKDVAAHKGGERVPIFVFRNRVQNRGGGHSSALQCASRWDGVLSEIQKTEKGSK
jgi:hypothetical protein